MKKIAIRCKEDQAVKLLNQLHDNGYTWMDNDTLLNNTEWSVHKENACYTAVNNSKEWDNKKSGMKITAHHKKISNGSVDQFKRSGFEVIDYDDNSAKLIMDNI